MKYLLFAVLVLSAFSCKKDEAADQIIYSSWPLTRVEGPATGTVNQVIPITISWPYAGGCDIVDKFVESRQGKTVTVSTLGYTAAGFCTLDVGIKTTIYHFMVTEPGVYTLKFVNGDAYIPFTVTVN